MVQEKGAPNAQEVVRELAQKFLGLPSPEKVLAELQRLNNSLEILQPDIHKLATYLSGPGANDIRNLTAALNKVDLNTIMRLLDDFNRTAKSIYEKLWGKLSK